MRDIKCWLFSGWGNSLFTDVTRMLPWSKWRGPLADRFLPHHSRSRSHCWASFPGPSSERAGSRYRPDSGNPWGIGPEQEHCLWSSPACCRQCYGRGGWGRRGGGESLDKGWTVNTTPVQNSSKLQGNARTASKTALKLVPRTLTHSSWRQDLCVSPPGEPGSSYHRQSGLPCTPSLVERLPERKHRREGKISRRKSKQKGGRGDRKSQLIQPYWGGTIVKVKRIENWKQQTTKFIYLKKKMLRCFPCVSIDHLGRVIVFHLE